MKQGDIITLDCGYNGMIDDRECRLLQDPQQATARLFPESPLGWSAPVMVLGTGETFTADVTHLIPKQ
jgi:hypothetical protein